jgi:hypothetical protein
MGPPLFRPRPMRADAFQSAAYQTARTIPPTAWPGYRLSVVSTEGRRPERRDLLSTIGSLLWREGLSARPGVYPERSRGGPWSRRRKSSHAIAPHRLARRPMSATLAAPSDAEVGMAQKTWEISGGGDALRELPPAPACLHEERDPGGRVRASGRYLTVRHGSGHVGVEDRLPSPARQPPDHGHESLPDHRGDEPGARRDSQRAPTRRPPAPAAGLTRGEW